MNRTYILALVAIVLFSAIGGGYYVKVHQDSAGASYLDTSGTQAPPVYDPELAANEAAYDKDTATMRR